MANIPITDLDSVATLAVGDEFPVVDASAGTTKRVTLANLATSFANVSSFKVPDATADGEAIAYDQASWQLGTGTLTGDLNLNEASPMIQMYDTDGTANFRKFRMFIDGSGNVIFRKVDDVGGTPVDMLVLSLPDGTVTVPDATADGEALAYDQAGARLAGLEVAATFPNLKLDHSGSTTDTTFETVATNGFVYMRVDGGVQAIRLFSDGSVNMESATSVAVPDFSTNVELSKAAPQLRLDDTAGTITAQILNTANDLYIRPAGGTSYFIMEMDTGVIRMANASVVTVPAVADGATSSAAQVTAYDSATGQLAIGGIEMGDTGWRAVTTANLGAPANITSSGVNIRRSGSTVTLYVFSQTLGGSYTPGGASADDRLTLPTGFTPSTRAVLDRQPIARNGSTGGTVNATLSAANDSYYFNDSAAAGNIIGSHQIQFETDDAWPATLPGTAA